MRFRKKENSPAKTATKYNTKFKVFLTYIVSGKQKNVNVLACTTNTTSVTGLTAAPLSPERREHDTEGYSMNNYFKAFDIVTDNEYIYQSSTMNE